MPKDTSYHKENLRRDLIAAGLAFVEENGHVSLSVRTLAQKVGVSPGAPYHHFADRRALLLAIATEGFDELIRDAAAIVAADLPPVERLTALGLAFVDFACKRPRLMELMYESELTGPTRDPALEPYQTSGQGLIRQAIVEGAPKDIDERLLEIRATAFWCAMYGFAALRRKQNIQSFDRFAMEGDDVARSVVGQAAANALAPV